MNKRGTKLTKDSKMKWYKWKFKHISIDAYAEAKIRTFSKERAIEKTESWRRHLIIKEFELVEEIEFDTFEGEESDESWMFTTNFQFYFTDFREGMVEN